MLRAKASHSARIDSVFAEMNSASRIPFPRRSRHTPGCKSGALPHYRPARTTETARRPRIVSESRLTKRLAANVLLRDTEKGHRRGGDGAITSAACPPEAMTRDLPAGLR